jgi:GDP-D-mannose dehydratase
VIALKFFGFMLQQDKLEGFFIAIGSQNSIPDLIDAATKDILISNRWTGKGAPEKGGDSVGKCIVSVAPS